MELVMGRCLNCGGTLQVESSKDAAICPYCNTQYIVKDAIQNYNTYNNNYIQNANINMGILDALYILAIGGITALVGWFKDQLK